MPSTIILYAGMLGIMNIIIASIPGRMRGAKGIAAGSGGDAELNKAMRRHANFTEFAPLALLLIALLEMQNVGSTAIHILGACLVIFRAIHAITFSDQTVKGSGRFIASAGTALTTIVTSIWLIKLSCCA